MDFSLLTAGFGEAHFWSPITSSTGLEGTVCIFMTTVTALLDRKLIQPVGVGDITSLLLECPHLSAS